MKIIVIKPHDEEKFIHQEKSFSIFLAGTIDNGNSEDWQSEIIQKLQKKTSVENIEELIIYNPRRDLWEKDLEEEEMEYQVNWELDHLRDADLIYMKLLPNSKSPISLLELGLFATSGKLHVSCPEEFYRYQNVRIVCERYGVPLNEETV